MTSLQSKRLSRVFSSNSKGSVGGRGEYNPVAPNTTAVGKQRNRRTQIIITPKLEEFLELIDDAPED